MDATYFNAMAIGLGNVFSWPNILIPLIGTAIVMVPSFLPGIGGLGIATFLLILTISWDPVSVLLLFGAVTGGATFMGSITAILFNIPGSAPSAAALLDGFPLAQKGFARTAIACAATASAVGSLFGVIVLILLIPAIRPLLLEFGPAERLLIGIWGLTTIIGIPGHSPFKAAAMCSLGFLAAMVGSDVRTGDARWIFGVDALYEGFGIIAVLIGFFTISEILGWDKAALTHNGTMHSAKGDSVLNGVKAVFRNMGLTIRSSGIGTLVGMMPGVGGTVASFIAYGQAANSSRGSGDTFGRGDIRGLIAPEAAVDAKDGGSLLPVVAFGLPGSEAGVVLLTVLSIHGLSPGIPMLSTELPLTFTLIAALLLSNITTSIVGVAITPWLAKLKSVRIERAALPILISSLVAALMINGLIEDVYVAMAFGLAGYLFKHWKWPIIPFVIAYTLERFIEINLSLTFQLIKIDRLSIFTKPGALMVGGLVAISVIWMLAKKRNAQREESCGQFSWTLPAVIAATAVVMLFYALLQTRGYSLFAIGVLLVAIALFGWAAIRESRSTAATGHTAAVPSKVKLRILALTSFSMTIPLFGLPAGMFALVSLWMLAEKPADIRTRYIALGFGVATAILTALILPQMQNVYLPEPWISF
jgi:putative tricarboxylic transport membrane protein